MSKHVCVGNVIYILPEEFSKRKFFYSVAPLQLSQSELGNPAGLARGAHTLRSVSISNKPLRSDVES